MGTLLEDGDPLVLRHPNGVTPCLREDADAPPAADPQTNEEPPLEAYDYDGPEDEEGFEA